MKRKVGQWNEYSGGKFMIDWGELDESTCGELRQSRIAAWVVLGVLVFFWGSLCWLLTGCGNPRIVLMYEDTADVGVEKSFELRSGVSSPGPRAEPTPIVPILP